jgi:hypothetical protein
VAGWLYGRRSNGEGQRVGVEDGEWKWHRLPGSWEVSLGVCVWFPSFLPGKAVKAQGLNPGAICHSFLCYWH